MDTRETRIERLGFDVASRDVETIRACNLCGSPHHVEVSRVDRYGYPVRLRVCSRCGLGFLSPRLTATEYAAFYADVYRPLVSAYHGRRIDAETVQAEQGDYAADLAAFLEEELDPRPATILDVGGSTGVVGGVVADILAARATILDPAPDELAVAAARGLETVAGFAEDFDPGERRWDLVLLCQTIDHLLDVAGTLAALRGLLAEGGRVFVDVLDVDFMLSRCGSIEGAVKVDHPYYLNRSTACAYFDRAGLDVVIERLSADGHWGFLLRRGEPREPDWNGLREAADAHLNTIWALRAAG